jgi:hypothetical protein
LTVFLSVMICSYRGHKNRSLRQVVRRRAL